MPSVQLTARLRDDYKILFNNCDIRPERSQEVEGVVRKIDANRTRYDKVETSLGVPWFVVAVTHNMEASLNFTKHLHNGHPLTARTVQVPAGRPKTGNPPFTWEQSAADALTLKGLSADTDWSLSGALYRLVRIQRLGLSPLSPGRVESLSLELLQPIQKWQIRCGWHLVGHRSFKAMRSRCDLTAHGRKIDVRVPGPTSAAGGFGTIGRGPLESQV